MTEKELLQYYDLKEKALIESLGADIEAIKQHMKEIERFANPAAQEARKAHIQEWRKQIREAAARRVLLHNLLDQLQK